MMETTIAGQRMASDEEAKEGLLHAAAERMLVMRRVMRRVMQEAKANSPLSAGLGEAQLFVLHNLSEEDWLNAGELANRCHVAEPTMSRTLNSMEASGLLTRQTAPHNRRTVQVSLTAAGREMMQRAQAEWIENLARAFRPLNAAQLEDLIRALGHLETLVAQEEPTIT